MVFGKVNDNDELAAQANMLLVRMCGVTPPQSMVNPILDAIFEAIRSSPVRLPSCYTSWLVNILRAVLEITAESIASGSRFRRSSELWFVLLTKLSSILLPSSSFNQRIKSSGYSRGP
jgi:hypothetical protein